MPELKSTLKVFNEKEIKGDIGASHAPGHVSRLLVGGKERPSERILVSSNIFEPGTYVPLHWHLIEGLYYCISGRAALTDIEGKTYDIVPGSAIYISPGIACAHSWQVKERLHLIAVRGTNSREKNIQFEVDKATMKSSIDGDYLVDHGGAQFKSFY